MTDAKPPVDPHAAAHSIRAALHGLMNLPWVQYDTMKMHLTDLYAFVTPAQYLPAMVFWGDGTRNAVNKSISETEDRQAFEDQWRQWCKDRENGALYNWHKMFDPEAFRAAEPAVAPVVEPAPEPAQPAAEPVIKPVIAKGTKVASVDELRERSAKEKEDSKLYNRALAAQRRQEALAVAASAPAGDEFKWPLPTDAAQHFFYERRINRQLTFCPEHLVIAMGAVWPPKTKPGARKKWLHKSEELGYYHGVRRVRGPKGNVATSRKNPSKSQQTFLVIDEEEARRRFGKPMPVGVGDRLVTVPLAKQGSYGAKDRPPALRKQRVVRPGLTRAKRRKMNGSAGAHSTTPESRASL